MTFPGYWQFLLQDVISPEVYKCSTWLICMHVFACTMRAETTARNWNLVLSYALLIMTAVFAMMHIDNKIRTCLKLMISSILLSYFTRLECCYASILKRDEKFHIDFLYQWLA